MTTDVKLLPLPEGEAIGWSQAWSHDQMHDYARANMEPLIEQLSDTAQALAAQTEQVKHYKAENERLRAEVAESRESWRAQVIERGNEIRLRERAEARAERLAEALRELFEIGDRYTGDQYEDAATYCAATDKARAALDQEGGK